MFNSILSTNLNLTNFAICILTSFVMGLVVAFVHAKTNRTNKNFTGTLVVLPSLVTIVILLVNGNLGTAVAVGGAFSLIRFRSIPGNSKEILSVFFAMAIGLAVGTGYIAYSIIFTLIASFIILLLDFIKFGDNKDKILKICIPEDLDYTESFDEIFNEYVNKYELMQTKTVNMGSMFELTYLVSLKHNINEKDFIDKIRVKNGNLKICLTHEMIGEVL